jgi:hypothetical protein
MQPLQSIINDALHLIVHSELLEVSSNRYEGVLRHIEDSVSNQQNVVRIRWKGGHRVDADIGSAVEFARSYQLVILYGCARLECLKRTAEALHKEGIPVAYSINGTT